MIGEVIACGMGLLLFVVGITGLPGLRFRRVECRENDIMLFRFFWYAVTTGLPLMLHLPIALLRLRASQLLGYLARVYLDDPKGIGAHDALYQNLDHLANRVAQFGVLLCFVLVLAAFGSITSDTRWRYLRKQDYGWIAASLLLASGYVFLSSTLSWWLD